MIKLEDLRIGNWILVPKGFVDSGCNKKEFGDFVPYRIARLLENDSFALCAGISLSMKLLFKCGFHKRDDMMVFQPEWQNIEFMAVEFPKDCWVISKGFINYNHELRGINYLHELMNLLWEVGRVELPISL